MLFTQSVCYEFQHLQTPTQLIIGQRNRTALGKAQAQKDVQKKRGNYPVLGKETVKKLKNAKLVEFRELDISPIEAYGQFIGPLQNSLEISTILSSRRRRDLR